MLVRGAWILIACAAACGKGDDGHKRTPQPPPTGAGLPADLSIAVEINGKAAAPITADRLRALEPDFATEDHRAWKLVRVLGDELPAGAVIEAEGDGDVSIAMRPPPGDADPQPVLVLTRRGEVGAAMVAPSEPFPDYHGHGGRLRRPGDPLPRVSPVLRLRVRRGGGGTGMPGAAQGAAAIGDVRVTLDGAPLAAWSAQAASALPVLSVFADGEHRPAWSLREIAALGGDDVRVAAVVGESRVELAAADWADASKTPVLRTNRRGTQVKFQWVNDKGEADKDTELREIVAIELAR